MKITNSKYFYYLIGAFSTFIILFSVYYLLGGFKALQVKSFDHVDYAIAGVEFKGKYNSREIEKYYNEAKSYIADGSVKGILALVDYVDQALPENEVHHFIGIILLDRITALPPDFEIRKFKASGILRVTLDIHPFVRPTKDDIEQKIYAVAQENGLELEHYFLEKHFADDRIMVEAFVR